MGNRPFAPCRHSPGHRQEGRWGFLLEGSPTRAVGRHVPKYLERGGYSVRPANEPCKIPHRRMMKGKVSKRPALVKIVFVLRIYCEFRTYEYRVRIRSSTACLCACAVVRLCVCHRAQRANQPMSHSGSMPSACPPNRRARGLVSAFSSAAASAHYKRSGGSNRITNGVSGLGTGFTTCTPPGRLFMQGHGFSYNSTDMALRSTRTQRRLGWLLERPGTRQVPTVEGGISRP